MKATYPAPRPRAPSRPQAVRDRGAWYDAQRVTVPASTAFSVAYRFAGRPDEIRIIRSANANCEIRLANIGEAPGTVLEAANVDEATPLPGADMIEFRDSTGAGGSTLDFLGIYFGQESPARWMGDRAPGLER